MTETVRGEELMMVMRKNSIDLEAWVEKSLRSRDMSGNQVYFLVYILRHHPNGTYITELCRELGFSKATLSALVKKLRSKGYLHFEENPGDIRKKRVLPTEKLAEEKKELVQRVRLTEEQFCGSLDQRERQQLLELEHKILKGLNRTEHKEVTA